MTKTNENKKARFIETITLLGHDALVPINRIKHINLLSIEYGYRLRITSDDGSWEEDFKDEKKANKRYENIKKALGTI